MNTLPSAMMRVEQAPVGADHAVKAILLAQQAGDDILVEAKAHLFDGQTDGLAVVGHDLAGAGLEGRLKGAQVVVKVVAGVDLLLAIGEVRVQPVFLRPAAGEVLGHAGHAGWADLSPWKPRM